MELNKAQLTGIVTLAMVLSGLVTVSVPQKTYYCESIDTVLECVSLSKINKEGTQTVCYTLPANQGGKRCTEGWKSINDFIEEPSIKVFVTANGKEWVCNTDNGKVQPYTKCFSGNYEGYLGELI